jgi:hypothetical protein
MEAKADFIVSGGKMRYFLPGNDQGVLPDF